MSIEQLASTDRDTVLRDRAVARLKKRRDFHTHLVVYTLVNGTLVAIWALADRHDFFWPIFFILFWGVGVVLNGWDVYRPEEFTEAQIQREIDRLQHDR